MKRITFRLPEVHDKRIQRLVDAGEYPNRSEAIRAYIREGLHADEDAEDGRPQPLQPAD